MNIDYLTIVYAMIPVCCAALGFILAKEAKIAKLASVNRRLRYGGSIIL